MAYKNQMKFQMEYFFLFMPNSSLEWKFKIATQSKHKIHGRKKIQHLKLSTTDLLNGEHGIE